MDPILIKMKGAFLAIVGYKAEIADGTPHLMVTYASRQEMAKDGSPANYKPSGFILLCLCKL